MPDVQIYQSKQYKLSGSSYKEVITLARREYHVIQKLSPRRQAYIRSKYFSQRKVFMNQFWTHLQQKPLPDQMRRLKYFACALDLLKNTLFDPDSILKRDDLDTTLYRFKGRTKEGELFYVQVGHNNRSGRNDFMSVFPVKIPK